MHLAAAVARKDTGAHDRPCVVVAGGREPPQWVTYPAHQFIHVMGRLPCAGAGCWKSRVKPLGDGDERDAPEYICSNVVGDLPRCMDMITAKEVIGRIEGYFEGGAIHYLTRAQSRVFQEIVEPDGRVPYDPTHEGPNEVSVKAQTVLGGVRLFLAVTL